MRGKSKRRPPSIPESTAHHARSVSGRNSHKPQPFRTRTYPDDDFQFFKHAPVSLWEEDFSAVKRRLDHLRRTHGGDLAAHFKKHPEEVLELAGLVKVLRVNDATLSLFGASNVKGFCSSLALVFSKESYEVFKKELLALSKGMRRFTSEAVNLTLQGEKRHVIVSLVIPPAFENSWATAYVAVTDISVLKERERELKIAEEKYRKLFEASPRPTLLADAATCIIVDANESAEHLFGCPVEEMVGQHLGELCPSQRAGVSRDKEQGRANWPSFANDGFRVQRKGRTVLMTAEVGNIRVAGRNLIFLVLREEGGKFETASTLSDSRQLRTETSLAKRITPREREVLCLIARGHTNHSAAKELGISLKTIETHRTRIMQKYDIHRMADLIRLALALGIGE